MPQTIEEKMDELLKSVNEMNITLRLSSETLKQVPQLDERITVLEHKQSRSEGSITGVKTVGMVFGALLVSAIGWLVQTTYKNDSNVALLLQRLGNVENIIHDIHK